MKRKDKKKKTHAKMPPGMRADDNPRRRRWSGGDSKEKKDLLESDGPVFPVFSTFYSLPTFRYANVLRCIVMLNGLLAVILWLCGKCATKMAINYCFIFKI